MRVLLIGRNGQVGYELLRCLAPLGEIVAPGRAELDLSHADSVAGAVRGGGYDWIVNAAAYTAVDKAEQEPEAARVLNADAPGWLAEEALREHAALVHYSTDYVFDGTSANPYVETDPTAPLNVYGRTKLAGELAIRATHARHLIFRTSWVYGARGQNFMRTILRLAREREELTVVDDQWGAPTWSRMIAEVTALAMARMASATPEDWANMGGVYHLAASGATTWHGFASASLALDPRREQQRASLVRPIPTREYPRPARRPLNSRLDCSALHRVFGLRLPDWKHSLAQVLDDVAGSV